MGVPKLSQFGLPGLWAFITSFSDLWSRWGLKQTCSSPWELSNGVSQSACTHRVRVDFRLLVVGSQTANLTFGPSFDHNLCCRCPNDSCEASLDIYTSRPFQWYKEHFKARCFDPCNRILSFWESQRTLKSHFRECEWRPHTSFKVGLRHLQLQVWATYQKNKKDESFIEDCFLEHPRAQECSWVFSRTFDVLHFFCKLHPNNALREEHLKRVYGLVELSWTLDYS